MTIRKVGIILKKDSSQPQQICLELKKWFAAKEIAVAVDIIERDMDLLVILGGDGTLLHVAAEAGLYGIPVVGINMGGLGFLTEVAVDERYQALEQIISGAGVVVEDRMMIKVRLTSNGESNEWLYALNDVVISKGNIDRLIQLSTSADEEYITTYKADGLVFSTPTGSTAYNLSAGGPIVHPGVNSILVTPICPFMLESRPVLLPAGITLFTKLAGLVNDVKVIVDGRFAWKMVENDVLEIAAATQPLKLICAPRKGYFGILRNKLNWGGRKE